MRLCFHDQGNYENKTEANETETWFSQSVLCLIIKDSECYPLLWVSPCPQWQASWGSPAVQGGLVRRVSEEASDSEQALAVFEGAAEPTVVLFGFLGRPADMDSLCTVPTQLTVQLICIYPLHIIPKVQLRSYNRTEYSRIQENRTVLSVVDVG